MAAKRQSIEGVFALNPKASAIVAVDRDLAATRALRDQLPADVQALSDATATCGREQEELQRSLQAEIAAANRRYAATLRDLNEHPEYSAHLRRRLAAVGKQIAGWRSALAAKAQSCRELAEQLAAARREYYSQLDQQWQQQMTRKAAAQQTLDKARSEAGAALTQSDAVVARVTAPDLSARIRALGQMAEGERLVLIVLIVTYGFFFLIDIMPVLAKLVMRTTYDRRISGDYRRAVAQIEAEAAMAEIQAAIGTAIAEAECRGLEALLHQSGNAAVGELAKLRMQMEIDKAEVAASFVQVGTIIEALHRTQAQADNLADRYTGRPELSGHIDAVREALAKAMARATASIKPQPTAAPAE
jgi:DNA repair exonuclease SbcCD ATPase subunit